MDERTAAEAYRHAALENAPPIKVVRLMYQGALRFLDQALGEDPAEAGSRFSELVQRVDAIVSELRLALDPEHDPKVCHDLEQLYLFVRGPPRPSAAGARAQAARGSQVGPLDVARGLERGRGRLHPSGVSEHDRGPEVFDALARVRSGLTGLLDAIAAAGDGDERLVESRRACEAAIEALGDPATLAERVAPGDTARLRSELEQVVRLQALASAGARAQHGELGSLVQTVQDVRKSLRYYAPAPGGDVCDLTG